MRNKIISLTIHNGKMKMIRSAAVYTIVGIFLVGIFLPMTVGALDPVSYRITQHDHCTSDHGVIVDFNSIGYGRDYSPAQGAQQDEDYRKDSDTCQTLCTGRSLDRKWTQAYSGVCCCENLPPIACPAGKKCLSNPLGTTTNARNIPYLIGNILKGLFGIIGTITLCIFIFGGFLWMTAFGEESKIKKGTDTMIWAGLGIAVIFGSYVAVDFILKAILGS